MQSSSIDAMAVNMMNMMFLTVGSSMVTSLAATITKGLTMFIPWVWYYIKKLYEPKQYMVTIQYAAMFSPKSGAWLSTPTERDNNLLIKSILEFTGKLPEQSESTKCNLGSAAENTLNNFEFAKSKQLELAPCKDITYDGFKINYIEELKESEKKEGSQRKIILTI